MIKQEKGIMVVYYGKVAILEFLFALGMAVICLILPSGIVYAITEMIGGDIAVKSVFIISAILDLIVFIVIYAVPWGLYTVPDYINSDGKRCICFSEFFLSSGEKFFNDRLLEKKKVRVFPFLLAISPILILIAFGVIVSKMNYDAMLENGIITSVKLDTFGWTSARIKCVKQDDTYYLMEFAGFFNVAVIAGLRFIERFFYYMNRTCLGCFTLGSKVENGGSFESGSSTYGITLNETNQVGKVTDKYGLEVAKVYKKERVRHEKIIFWTKTTVECKCMYCGKKHTIVHYEYDN